jgi:hypothetical protein
MSTLSRGLIVFVTMVVVAGALCAPHIFYLGSPQTDGYLVGGVCAVVGVVVWHLTGRQKA